MLKTNEKIIWTSKIFACLLLSRFPPLSESLEQANQSAADSFSEEANYIATYLRGRDKNNNSIPLGLERIKDTGKSLPSFVNFGS